MKIGGDKDPRREFRRCYLWQESRKCTFRLALRQLWLIGLFFTRPWEALPDVRTWLPLKEIQYRENPMLT